VIATTYRKSNPLPENARLAIEHVVDGRHMVELGGGITLYVDASEAYALSHKFEEIAEAIVEHEAAKAVA
jgi:hypothetical protein